MFERMNARLALFLVLAGAAGVATALDVSDERRFVCKQGDCRNGQGTVWDAFLSMTMQGNWAGGHTIPGATYILVSPVAPDRKFKQVYGQDGFLASGDQPRTIAAMNGIVPFFSGTYTRLTHAFMRQPVAVVKQGVYNTGTGFEYRGRFEYLPSKGGMAMGLGSGYYIFYGDKIDTEEDEKETGLFVSEETLGGAPVRFVKATPGYLAVMQRKYQRDLQLAQVEFKQQEAEKGWRTAFAVLGKVALTLASGGGNLGGGGGNSLTGEFAMNLVSGMLNNGGEVNVKEMALQAVGAAVVGDKQLGSALGKAVSEGIDEANR
jgi:hypothetical protein